MSDLKPSIYYDEDLDYLEVIQSGTLNYNKQINEHLSVFISELDGSIIGFAFDGVSTNLASLVKAQDRVDQLQSALKFYAHADSWTITRKENGIKYSQTIEDDTGDEELGMNNMVGGNRARQALNDKAWFHELEYCAIYKELLDSLIADSSSEIEGQTLAEYKALVHSRCSYIANLLQPAIGGVK